MGDVTGFIKYQRAVNAQRPIEERIKDYKETSLLLSNDAVTEQAARCMDCGVPFCHSGCPLGNIIPAFNDAVYRKDWYNAYQILSDTNNFPEFTGRICPAPCEAACVLGINTDAVTIEAIEKKIIETAYENGWVKPYQTIVKTGKKIAIVGSGPSGLATADQLCKVGHEVHIYERNDKIGGLLTYGIPDFKLSKDVVVRRIEVMQNSGVTFHTNVNVGVDITADDLMKQYDAICLCAGSTIPRDIAIPGRELEGVYFAMDYLESSNRFVASNEINAPGIHLMNKEVVVIGGGDTGADCVGTSIRQGAKSVRQIELLAKPGGQRTGQDPWPLWPMILRSSSSHEEGCLREWSLHTKAFIGDKNGKVTGIHVIEIEWKKNDNTNRFEFAEIVGTDQIIPCQAALIAVGFLYCEKNGLLNDLGIACDERGNVISKNHQTNVPRVFTAGDMRRGQSLVVWAISEGREAAVAIDTYLNDGRHSNLERKEVGALVM